MWANLLRNASLLCQPFFVCDRTLYYVRRNFLTQITHILVAFGERLRTFSLITISQKRLVKCNSLGYTSTGICFNAGEPNIFVYTNYRGDVNEGDGHIHGITPIIIIDTQTQNTPITSSFYQHYISIKSHMRDNSTQFHECPLATLLQPALIAF